MGEVGEARVIDISMTSRINTHKTGYSIFPPNKQANLWRSLMIPVGHSVQ